MSAEIKAFDVFEDTGEQLLAHVDYAGTDATILNTSAVTYRSYNISSGALVTNGSLTVASVMFASLQTGAEWVEDQEGYNFAWDAPGTLWPDPGITYQLEITFTPASGQPRVLVWKATTKALYGS